MKILKRDFDKLYGETISKKEFDQILQKIDDRFIEIVNKLLVSSARRNSDWFDYANHSFNKGYFDLVEYKENIYIGGENEGGPKPYNSSFPTRWLWEDFEDEFNREAEKAKQILLLEENQKKIEQEILEKKKIEIRKIIESKLTAEELEFILFK